VALADMGNFFVRFRRTNSRPRYLDGTETIKQGFDEWYEKVVVVNVDVGYRKLNEAAGSY
jgi:hypothetical protein